MEQLDSRRLKNSASESIVKAEFDPRKLVLFHTAVMLALSLAVVVMDFVLEQQIGNTGGLSGVGMRSVLETVQTVLQQAQIIALPFWQIGWVYASLKIARGETAGNKDLLEGFRQFFPQLRLMILKGLIFFGLAFAGMYAGALVATMLPAAGNVMDLTNPALTDEQWMALFLQMMLPMMVIGCVAALALCVPFFYRFRLAEYFMLERPQLGARVALRASRNLMRGRMWQMMRLDLSFWWFGLMTVAVSTLGLADVLLPWMGIELPWSAEISYFVTYLLAAAAQLVLHYFCKAKVDATYAHAYLSLLPKEEMSNEAN